MSVKFLCHMLLRGCNILCFTPGSLKYLEGFTGRKRETEKRCIQGKKKTSPSQFALRFARPSSCCDCLLFLELERSYDYMAFRRSNNWVRIFYWIWISQVVFISVLLACNDANITDRIVRAAGNIKNSVFLEIGSGPGSLTRSCLTQGARASDTDLSVLINSMRIWSCLLCA